MATHRTRGLGPKSLELLIEMQQVKRDFAQPLQFWASVLDWDYRRAESAMSKLRRRGLVAENGRQFEAKCWLLTEEGKNWNG